MPTIQKKLITLITRVSKANPTLKLNMHVIYLARMASTWEHSLNISSLSSHAT